MPNREQRRSGEGSMSAKIAITTGGHRYEMKLGDFSALDEFDFYKITGMTLMSIFASGQITTFAVAGLIWLHRRPYEPKLTFEDVARTLKFADLDSVELEDESNDEYRGVLDNPEA